MKPLALTDVSRDLASIIDRAADDHEPVLITRGDGKPAAVLMSLENFASRSPANAQALRETIAELETGRTLSKGL